LALLATLIGAAVTWALLDGIGWRWEVVGYWVWIAGLVALSWIDARTQRLPRRLIWLTAAVGAPWLVIGALVHHQPERLFWAVGTAATFAVVMAGLYALSRGGLGFGDVRLAPLLGLFLGYLSWRTAAVGLFLGFGLGALGGILGVATRRLRLRSHIAFGPYLCAGSVVAILLSVRGFAVAG